MKTALLTALSSESIPADLRSKLTPNTLNPTSLDLLIEFILQPSEGSRDLTSIQKQLAYALLLEPYPLSTKIIQALAHLLLNEQLLKIIFELRSQNSNDMAAEER